MMGRDKPKPHRYHLMNAQEKERYARGKLRRPATHCPNCEIAVQPDELLAHMAERCPGHGAVHALEVWLPWGEVISLGVTDRTLRRWAARGLVRTTETEAGRQYLQRDVIMLMARRRSWDA